MNTFLESVVTNDVSKIKDLLKEQLDLEHPYVDTSEKSQQGPASAQ